MEKWGFVSELVSRGLVRGSAQWKREYIRLWREKNKGKWKEYYLTSIQKPGVKEKRREAWRRFYRSKGTDWTRKRVSAWRKANPDKWAAIMKKASQNGLHKRWYKNHRSQKLKASYERKKRDNPLYGLTKLRQSAKRGDTAIETYLCELGAALVRFSEESNKGRRQSTDSQRGVRVRGANS